MSYDAENSVLTVPDNSSLCWEENLTGVVLISVLEERNYSLGHLFKELCC